MDISVIAISAFKDNYVWLIINHKNHQAICIDPGESAGVVSYLYKHELTLEAVLITHHHSDHTAGVSGLIKQFPAPVYGPQDSRLFKNALATPGSTLFFSKLNFKVLASYGHTVSHISYYEPEQKLLFCGDALFSAGCGRLFEGNTHDLYQTLAVFKSLPDECRIYCAHEYTKQNLLFAQTVEPNNLAVSNYLYQLDGKNRCTLPSTMGLEKKINPFLRLESPEVQIFVKAKGGNSLDEVAKLAVLRQAKDIF